MQKKARRKSLGAWTGLIGAAALLFVIGIAVAVAARLWPGNTTSGRPPTAAAESAAAPLYVGMGWEPLPLASHPSLAGYGLSRPPATQSSQLSARAISFGPFAIVALDLLEIPNILRAAVSAKFPDQIVWVCATHTHSGPGGYDPSPLAQVAGARSYNGTTFYAVLDAAVKAIRSAQANALPAKLRIGRAPHPELKRGRSHGATPDPTLWALEATTLEGQMIGRVADFGAHATIVPRSANLLSADWPGAAALALPNGVVLQGVGGDSSPITDPTATSLDQRLTSYGSAIAEAARAALPATSATGALLVEQRPVTVTFAPLLGVGTSLTTSIGLAKLGDTTLVCLPGELTGAARADLEAKVPWLKDALIITLCGDELSYVESPRLQQTGQGERLVLFPDAVDAFAAALSAPIAGPAARL